MALKDLLVHVDSGKAAAGRIDAALRLSTDHQAHLTGLYILRRENIVPGYIEAQIPGEVIEAQKKAEAERAAKAEEGFTSAADRAGVSSEWRCVDGALAPTLSLHARYVDMVIMGQADKSDPFSITEYEVEHAILDVGRPALVIPYVGAAKTFGKRVMVAWDGSREAMRAIHEALPLLERADEVHVLSVDTGGTAGHGDVPGADISLHLARHNIKVEASSTPAREISVGDTLLSRAADKSIDLIVMGAYGHSRYRELVLGGVTRRLLQSMTVPTLMSH